MPRPPCELVKSCLYSLGGPQGRLGRFEENHFTLVWNQPPPSPGARVQTAIYQCARWPGHEGVTLVSTSDDIWNIPTDLSSPSNAQFKDKVPKAEIECYKEDELLAVFCIWFKTGVDILVS